MNIKNIISLKEVSQDLKIAKEFYENTVIVVAVLDLRQNPKNINFFINERI